MPRIIVLDPIAKEGLELLDAEDVVVVDLLIALRAVQRMLFTTTRTCHIGDRVVERLTLAAGIVGHVLSSLAECRLNDSGHRAFAALKPGIGAVGVNSIPFQLGSFAVGR